MNSLLYPFLPKTFFTHTGTLLTLHFLFTYLRLKSSKKKKDELKNSGILQLIGSTPLIYLESLSNLTQCHIYAKVEFLNIGGSPKDRVALKMIEDAEAKGFLKPHRGDVVFEGTVGSTGISLATVCKAKGYTCHIVMPNDQALEKYELLEKLGAKVEKVKPASIVDPFHFVNVARRRAHEMNLKNEQDEHCPRG